MNSWVVKCGVSVVVATAVVLSGCASVEDARADAIAEVEGMRFLKQADSVKDRLERAQGVKDVERILKEAKDENSDAEAKYWSCAQDAVDDLSKVWSTYAIDPAGKVFVEYQLGLGREGTVSLEKRDTASVVGDRTQTRMTRWLAENTGQTISWSSDLKTVFDEKRLPGGDSPGWSDGEQCRIDFTLVLGSDEFDAVLLGDGGASGLTVEDQIFGVPED